jgi:hypothetical protein
MIAHVNAEDQTHTPVLFRHPNTHTPTTLIQEKTSSWKFSFFLNQKKNSRTSQLWSYNLTLHEWTKKLIAIFFFFFPESEREKKSLLF